jgi:TetR/AcrR family transcriptional repressor of nem operon
MSTTDTRESIMSVARSMVQAHGYNALSFRELAKAVGVKSASVHYHFPTKADLAAALAQRYTEDASAFLEELLDSDQGLAASFAAYTAIFRAALESDNRMCLWGIMAAEHDDLPETVRIEVDKFSLLNVRWLTRLLAREIKKPNLVAIKQKALAIFAAIEGAQLLARGRGDIKVYDQIIATYRASGLLA